MKVKSLGRVQLFATPWTVAYEAPPSRGFSRQEYWSGSPFPSPGDLPDPGIKPSSPTLEADALTSEPPGKPKTIYQDKDNDYIYTQNDSISMGEGVSQKGNEDYCVVMDMFYILVVKLVNRCL